MCSLFLWGIWGLRTITVYTALTSPLGAQAGIANICQHSINKTCLVLASEPESPRHLLQASSMGLLAQGHPANKQWSRTSTSGPAVLRSFPFCYLLVGNSEGTLFLHLTFLLVKWNISGLSPSHAGLGLPGPAQAAWGWFGRNRALGFALAVFFPTSLFP